MLLSIEIFPSKNRRSRRFPQTLDCHNPTGISSDPFEVSVLGVTQLERAIRKKGETFLSAFARAAVLAALIAFSKGDN